MKTAPKKPIWPVRMSPRARWRLLVRIELFGFLFVALLASPGSCPDTPYSVAHTPESSADVIPREARCESLLAAPWSLFHPVWENGDTELQRKIARLVSDPDDRIEDQFAVPAFLRDRVRFWLLVHAFYGKRMRVLHNRERLDLVYGHIDFRPLYASCGAAQLSDRRLQKLERAINLELKRRLTLAAHPNEPRTREIDGIRRFFSVHGALDAKSVDKLLRAGIRTQTGQRDEFRAALKRSKELMPFVESSMRRHGMPVALARIPFVESSFNAAARSRVGAVGMWQFMPDTARLWLGSRNRTVWGDPLRQTTGAVQVFKHLRAQLPDWGTAITAYNSGAGRLKRLVRKHGAKDLKPILDATDWYGLGFAGKNFYAQFLSANLVEAYETEIFHSTTEPADEFLVRRFHSRSNRLPAGH